MNQWISDYITAQKAALDSIPVETVALLIEKLRAALHAKKHIFVFGNGGSASNASHFVTDLSKGASDKVGERFRCVALNDNISWITAIANDYEYADVFRRQLENFGEKGDVVLAISVSGSSPNVVSAVEWAKANGLEVIVLVGAKRGPMAKLADHALVIDSTHYGRVEDAQMAILHILCYAFIENPHWGNNAQQRYNSSMPVNEQIRNKVSELPHKPGVYLMKDRFGTVIYVGKARDLRKRVSVYFHPSRRMGWDLKFNALIDAIHDFDTYTVRSEPEALLLEGKLIKEYQPRYNISFRDDKRFLLIKVNLNDPIPRFMLTRLRVDDGARYFGPFAHAASARHTLTMARHKFNLRGCRPFTPGEADYKHCLYGHLKYCTAPCIGNVTREEYRAQLAAACDFLAGQTDEMEHDLEEQMKRAAAAEDFEKAAQFRDALQDLRRTTRKTRIFTREPYKLPVAIEPHADLAELSRSLDLPANPARIEGFDISNISGTFAVASMVSFHDGRPDRSNYRRFRIKTVVGQDDFACMAETVRRRYSRVLREAQERGTPPNLPDLIVIDGGKGQLNAALAELEKLGQNSLNIIGLAKEFEEIYRPGQPEPLRLSHDSGALKLLQRVRDESHRFANTYNAQLRLKRISESILDEFPGIGQQRKAALLKRFGSLQRLRLATVEDIAAVPGFGGKAAEELKKFLEARSVTPARPESKAEPTATGEAA